MHKAILDAGVADPLQPVLKKEFLAFVEKSGARAEASTGTLLQVVEQLRGSLLSFVKLCSSSFSSSHGGTHRWDVFQGDATFHGQVDPPSCAVKQCMFCDGEKACVCGWNRDTQYLLGGAGLQVW